MTEIRGFCRSGDGLQEAGLSGGLAHPRCVAIATRVIVQKLTAQIGHRQSRAPFTTKPRQIGRLRFIR